LKRITVIGGNLEIGPERLRRKDTPYSRIHFTPATFPIAYVTNFMDVVSPPRHDCVPAMVKVPSEISVPEGSGFG
jgi:hypothetical protein